MPSVQTRNTAVIGLKMVSNLKNTYVKPTVLSTIIASTDGTGYAEDGRDFFEDEDEYSDGEEGQSDAKKKKSGVAKKRPRDSEKPVKGKASIRNLFSNAIPKKADAKNSVKDDDILADLLGEIKEEATGEATNATPKQQKVIAPAKIVAATRKSDAAAAKEYMNSFLSNIKMQEQQRKKAEAGSDDEMLERILQPKATGLSNKKATVTVANIKQEKLLETDEQSKKAEDRAEPEFCDNDLDFSCLDDDENQFEVAASKSKPKPEPQPEQWWTKK